MVKGDRVPLWHDRWWGKIPLKEAFPALFACASNQAATITLCIVNQREGMLRAWDVTFNRNFNDWEVDLVMDFLDFLHSHVPVREEDDGWRWRRKRIGDFDTKSFNTALRGNMEVKLFPWQSIWGSKAPRRIVFFLWTTTWGKILTNDNLMRRGHVMAEWCCMCRGTGETVDHLMLHCPLMSGLWNYIFHSFGIQWILSAQVMDLLFAWRNWFGKHSSAIWNLVLAYLMWIIWREHNRRIFEELECSDNQLQEIFIYHSISVVSDLGFYFIFFYFFYRVFRSQSYFSFFVIIWPSCVHALCTQSVSFNKILCYLSKKIWTE